MTHSIILPVKMPNGGRWSLGNAGRDELLASADLIDEEAGHTCPYTHFLRTLAGKLPEGKRVYECFGKRRLNVLHDAAMLDYVELT